MQMKLGTTTFEYDPKYTMEEFLKHNYALYENDYNQDVPGGDASEIDLVDFYKKEIIEVMQELYHEWLTA